MKDFRKTANHVSELNHEIVENEVTNFYHNKEGYFATTFDLAKGLLSELPIVPTNDRVYELVQDIENGDFDDIAPLEEARQNWQAYIDRTREILVSRRILISKLRKTHK